MSMPFFASRQRQRGFTLIELMITVAIIGILLRLAYPAYTNSVIKTRRADAKTALMDLAQREERYLATANAYTDTATALGYPAGTTVTAAAPMNVLSGSTAYYQLKVVPTAPNAATGAPAMFTATAIPIGTQALKDTACGSFILTETGAQSVNGTDTAANCW